MHRADARLRPNTIVAFEVAFTPRNAKAILESWGPSGQDAARRSLLLDVGFIVVGYVPLLASLCLVLARRTASRPRGLGVWLALAALLAGALDLIENAALGGVLRTPSDPSAVLTWTAGIAATLKFLLAVTAAVYVVVGLGRELARATPLVQWFLSYPVLLLAAALVFAVVWRLALSSAGIPDLFWEEAGLMQFLAGVGVGALLSHLGVIGFLLDAQRATLRGRAYRARWAGRISVGWLTPRLPWVSEASVMLSGYLLRTSVPLLALVLASGVRAPGGVSPWWLPLGGVVSFALYSAGSVWIAARGAPQLWTVGAVRRRIDAVDPALRNLHRLAYFFVVAHVAIFLLLGVLYRAFEQGVSAALAVSVLLAGIASAYGFLKHFFAGNTFGLLTGLVVAFVALNALGGHRLRHLDYYRRVRVTDRTRLPKGPLLRPAEHLEAWRRARGGERPPLVVVAVDGGGIRAAVWTSIVLGQLECEVPDLPYFVRVVTGASGGMVGVASYVASLQPPSAPDRHADLGSQGVSLRELVDRVATDSLGTVARELVFKDLPFPAFLHPWSDRGLALERAWEQNTNILAQPFAQLAAGEAAGWRPSLIVSPFIIEDGRRLLISNLDLESLTTVPVAPPSVQAIEYFRMIEPHPGALGLSTAVRLNASFPYVSPPAELPTDPPRRLLDAGYYDEHGVDLAGTWIWTNREWLLANTSGVLLVQVPDARARRRKGDASVNREDWWGAGLVGVTGPVQALRTSESAAADYRNDQLVRFLGETLNRERPGMFETVVFEPDETSPRQPPAGCRSSWPGAPAGEQAYDEVALSWRLTACEVSRLKEAIRGGEQSASCADRRQFQDWWNQHKPASEPVLSVRCPPLPL
jgi:hypothetical protein